MNRKELRKLLDAEEVDRAAYSLRGRRRDERLVLERGGGQWTVYFDERGGRTGEEVFALESDACSRFFERLIRNPTVRRPV